MEVFLHNLPLDLTEYGLKGQLDPVMGKLRIIDYQCEKPKKKRFGYITFLDKRDGEHFLTVHGQEPLHARTGARSRLQLIGSDVYCMPSNKKAKDFAVRNLQYASDQRGKEIYEDDEAISFQLFSYSCGYCTFLDEHLAYVPEEIWEDPGIIKFKKRNIIVKLNSRTLVRIPLSTVVDFVWFTNGTLTLTLSTVPFLSSGDESSGKTKRSRLCSLSPRHAKVVGQCLVYQFKVSPVDLPLKVQQLKNSEISITFYNLAFGSAEAGYFDVDFGMLMKSLGQYFQSRQLPFEILFQLQALAQNAYLHPQTVYSLTTELSRMFERDKAAGRKPISADAMQKLFGSIDWPYPDGDPDHFKVRPLIALLKEKDQETREGFTYREGLSATGRHLARINKVIVTPTRVTLHGGEIEPNNRILRKFPNHHDCFIRAQFCDENGENIHFNAQVNYDDVFSRFKRVMKLGIEIAGRTYKFLGFSNSSLRSHAVWFSCPFVDENGDFQTHFSIIKALGNFSKILSPARCAARIGQAFSETPFTVPLNEHEIFVSTIQDATSPDGSRVFSDGVGALSFGVAKAIWSNVPNRKGRATCFQIRYGGSKGMLAVDSRLVGSLIQIRPSMTKFESKDTQELEICDMASKPIPLVLNRQMVKILEDMGVSEDWFFERQKEALENIRGITSSAFSIARFLDHHNIGDPIALHRLFRQCRLLQLEYKREPFLLAIVEAVILRELCLLKRKARIPVKKGITLFGIMDETGFLEGDQVYVTYDTVRGRHLPPPGPGRLLVTRSPALYDGDIQFGYNVVPPQDHPLTTHRNCIVFSRRGKRDLPSQLSGGDLDGDLYNVIWDPDAMPMRTFEPADYPRVAPVSIGREVETDDIVDFFVDFMRTDHLGIIATRHMILADQREEGTSHPDCKKLAELHSTAVDFSKTGIPVKMEDLPPQGGYRPDFLAPGPQTHIYNKSDIALDEYIVRTRYDEDEESEPPRKYYKSEKILGKLYRNIHEHKIWSENVRFKREPGKKPFWDEFISAMAKRCEAIGPVMWTHQAENARQIRAAYEDAIIGAMNSFSEHPVQPITELEVFLGTIMSKTGAQTNRQRDRSIKLKGQFERIAGWITGALRRDRSRPLTGYEKEFDSLELCLACVHVGGQDNRGCVMRGRREEWYGRMESFRVVAACALLAELDYFEKGLKAGGFVGVQSGRENLPAW